MGAVDLLGRGCQMAVGPAEEPCLAFSPLLVGSPLGGLLEMLHRYAAPLAADGAGLDENHFDAEIAHLHPQASAESYDGIFRCVVPVAAGFAEVAGHRRHVDDASAALLPHIWKHELGEAREAEDIYVELPAGLLLGHRLERAEVAVARIVDQNVDAPLLRDYPPDTLLHGGLVGYVHIEQSGARVLERRHPLKASRRGINLMPCGEQPESRAHTDAGGGTGYKNDFMGFHILALWPSIRVPRT